MYPTPLFLCTHTAVIKIGHLLNCMTSYMQIIVNKIIVNLSSYLHKCCIIIRSLFDMKIEYNLKMFIQKNYSKMLQIFFYLQQYSDWKNEQKAHIITD